MPSYPLGKLASIRICTLCTIIVLVRMCEQCVCVCEQCVCVCVCVCEQCSVNCLSLLLISKWLIIFVHAC